MVNGVVSTKVWIPLSEIDCWEVAQQFDLENDNSWDSKGRVNEAQSSLYCSIIAVYARIIIIGA